MSRSDGIAYELLRFAAPTRLDHWCAAHGRPEAIVAGFVVRDPHRPLGEVRLGGVVQEHEPVAAPWAERRACVHIDDQPAPESRPVVTALLFEPA
jgi:hypothetical protein